MIIEYHRPRELTEALALLGREAPLTIPLGGGSAIDHVGLAPVAVVDLQALSLNLITRRGAALELGATVTLQSLLDWLAGPEGSALPIAPALSQAIRLEATHNLRQVATVAGTLAAAGGRSPFAAALLALDAGLTLLPGGPEQVDLGDLLPVRSTRLKGRLITAVTLPAGARLAFHSAARTPADAPIVCAAGAAWPSGRVRLALGGFGAAPTLAFDGGEADGAESAAHSAYAAAGDEWASAEYRSQTGAVLARRCLADLHN